MSRSAPEPTVARGSGAGTRHGAVAEETAAFVLSRPLLIRSR
jgi:hypothetical protein